MAEKTAVARAIAPEARLSLGYALVAGTVVVVSQALPWPALVKDLAYNLVSLSVVVAILVGIRRHRPSAPSAWYLMAAGQASWVIADLLFSWEEALFGLTGFPTIADLFYLLGYPVFAVSLSLLVRDRARSRREMGPLLDSATVTAGLTLLSWILLARPTIESMDSSIGAAIVAAAYPAMDILLVGGLIRLVSSPGGRSQAFRYLLVALLLLVTADTLSVAFDLYASNEFAAVDYLWMFSYVTWGAAALHPSMTTLSDPVSNPQLHFRGVRLLAVILATMIAPSILAVHEITGVPVDNWAVIVGSVVMFLLVVIRMNLAIEQIAAAHEALEVLQDELSVQATHDPLTGLANRVQSMRLLAGALGRARRKGSTVGLLFIDLDGFKEVNDTHGHRSGDEVLRQAARRMEQVTRDGDFLGRLGGDEFVIGIEDAEDETSAVTLANRLVAVMARPIQVTEDLSVQIGASVGVALGRGGETDVETLLHEADLAVYQAKAAGRGRSEVFSGTARAALKVHNDVERALVRALAEDELVLHYQPIFHLPTGQIECYEALVRWERPGVGLLPPSEFLPVAETSDLICDLDAWVLRAAVAQLSAWNLARGDTAMQVAVNISGRHISQHRILDDVAATLRSSDILPPQLVIEVTETALMDGSLAAANLEALRAMGIVVSLDDFGTGYQSSTQLWRLPVDVVKIDREFVDASTPSARTLLELMVRAAHAFGARVVAEGVEREDQLDLLRELGCEFVQGFGLGYPAPADQLDELADQALLIPG